MKKTATVSSSAKQGKASSKQGKTSTKKVLAKPVAKKTAATVKGTVKGREKAVSKKTTKSKAPVTIAKMTIQQSVGDDILELTSEQLESLKQRLTELTTEIKASLAAKTEHFNSSAHNESVIKGDDAEVAEKQRQSNAALQEMDMLKNRLLMVERALKKIEQGTYGLCEETEEPIAFERLTAIPWARYSVKVQEMRERRLREYNSTRVGL